MHGEGRVSLFNSVDQLASKCFITALQWIILSPDSCPGFSGVEAMGSRCSPVQQSFFLSEGKTNYSNVFLFSFFFFFFNSVSAYRKKEVEKLKNCKEEERA